MTSLMIFGMGRLVELKSGEDATRNCLLQKAGAITDFLSGFIARVTRRLAGYAGRLNGGA